MTLPLRRGALAIAAPLLVAACAGRTPVPVATRPVVAGVGTPEVAAAAADRRGAVAAVSEEDLAYLRERELLVPVAGARASRVPESFDEARSGDRVHQATDILAARGTPVLAADDGRVWKLRSSALGGITVYTIDPLQRFVFYYAHLQGYRDGLTEGAAVLKGDTLGFVGTTGNAPPNVPHLHFQISRVARPGQWWGGTPVDPLPFLRAADAARVARAAAPPPAGVSAAAH